MHQIRVFEESDWDAVWQMLEPVFRAGETYPMSPEITEEEARQHWIKSPTATYVSVGEYNELIGTYYIRPNQPALGAHVCNCGYVVGENARGQGVATEMCKHSQTAALALGFRAMQLNLVVSTNVPSVRLWPKLGFEVVGTLPGAFRHSKLGYVDAFVMYKALTEHS